MRNGSYIIEAIDLLMHYAEPKPKPKIWIKVFDYVFTALYLSAFVFVIYKLVVWLS